MRAVVGTAVLVLVLAASGCGGSNGASKSARRKAVTQYIERVDSVEQQLRYPLLKVEKTYKAFTTKASTLKGSAANLAVGIHSLTATQTLVAAVTSNPSAAASVTVMPPNPAAPTISAPVTATMSTSVVLNGTGVAGNLVTVYDGTAAIATTTIAADGTWTLMPTLALGAHTLTATQTDQTWNLVSVKSSSVTVTVYAQPPAPVITSVSTPAQTKTTTPVTVKGTGVAGETITLYDGSTAVGTATVNSSGTWQLTVSLASGTHTLTATQTLTAGVTSTASAAVSVTVPAH